MVKKKGVKKVKRVSKGKKGNSSTKVRESTRRDFEVFAKGVERLEELRAELNNLNTKGYEQESASIRSKLKNVSYIPQIEREIKDLKAKLSGTYKEKVNDAHKDILKKVSDLKKIVPNNSGIHRKIRELEKHIPNKEKLSRKIRSIEKDVELVRNVPKMQKQIRDFKEFVDNKRKEDIRKAEMLKKLDPNINFLINDKFNLSLNEIKTELANQVNDKETIVENQLQEDFNTRIKNFERKYYLLERDLEKKYRDRLKDSLQKEVKSRFSKTLNEKVGNIKIRLIRDNNRRLENERKNLRALKEKKIRELKKSKERLDLLRRKLIESTNKKIAEINREKNTKLKAQINILNKERNDKLNQISKIKNALIKRKDDLDESNVKWLKSVEAKMRAEEGKKLIESINRKSSELTSEFNNKLKDEVDALRKHKDEEILMHKSLLDKRMNGHLTEQVRGVNRKYNNKVKKHNQEISKIKERLSKESGTLSNKKNLLASLKDSLDMRVRKVKANEENYRREVMSQLELEKQREIEIAVRKKSAEIRNKLKRDFDNRLKLELKAKEAEFDKRKSELALEIQEKAKVLFE